jgi:uncharacterized protein YheU (UPF0270 family)
VIEIPFKRLDNDVLTAIIEEFVLREGTDYGAQEADFENKVTQVRSQLESGDVLITYDPKTENCTLLTRKQFRQSILATVPAEGVPQKDIATYNDYYQDLDGLD